MHWNSWKSQRQVLFNVITLLRPKLIHNSKSIPSHLCAMLWVCWRMTWSSPPSRTSSSPARTWSHAGHPRTSSPDSQLNICNVDMCLNRCTSSMEDFVNINCNSIEFYRPIKWKELLSKWSKIKTIRRLESKQLQKSEILLVFYSEISILCCI